jgi:asparagine synthase (glutamine-hydrolysing)
MSLGADFAGVTVLEEDGLVVAADASLYYRAELHAALLVAGRPPRGPSASHYLLAAWRAGAVLVERLEGDFAFVLWNERERRLLAARDFQGTRPLPC